MDGEYTTHSDLILLLCIEEKEIFLLFMDFDIFWYKSYGIYEDHIKMYYRCNGIRRISFIIQKYDRKDLKLGQIITP